MSVEASSVRLFSCCKLSKSELTSAVDSLVTTSFQLLQPGRVLIIKAFVVKNN